MHLTVPLKILFLRNGDGYGGAFVKPAFKRNLAAEIFDGVLDYRKPQSRSADLFGMAFINAEKSLKYPFLLVFGNADAGVGYRDLGKIALILYAYLNGAVFTVVFNGIVAKVVYYFAHKS